MNRAQESWLLPTALVGYVSLAAARGSGDGVDWTVLFAPLLVAGALRYVARHLDAGRLATSIQGVRLSVIGCGLYGASAMGPADGAAFQAAEAVGQGLLTASALLCIARLTPPPGLLSGHPVAESLDAMWLSVVMWTTVMAAALLRALAPGEFPLDPVALDTSFIFASLGSLLLLCASFLRTRLLRGLELGVGDRIQAGLSLAISGAIVGASSGFVEVGSSNRVAGVTLIGTCTSVVMALAAPNAGAVTQTVRGLIALLLIGLPTAIAGAWFALRLPDHARSVALAIAAVGMMVGLIARSMARPLGPEGSRWLVALRAAMDAALHPEPEGALRGALSALRKAEPTSKARPELFRMDPPGMLSVDIAGYLTDDEVDFPDGVVSCALNEPYRTLRLETVLSAQVRKPFVRALVTWFDAHDAKTTTVLVDDTGAIGVLSLPKGRRRSNLSMEEAELLARLAERLAGLISVTASLRRARDRELGYRRQAASASEQANDLRSQLSEQNQEDQLEAESRVAILRAAAHGPTSQIKKQELQQHGLGPSLTLETPLGVDPIPWAAYAHLSRQSQARPFVVLDLSEEIYRTRKPWENQFQTSPWKRAHEGSLVLCHPGALSAEFQVSLSDALERYRPLFVVLCRSEGDQLLPRLERQLVGPTVRLPTLAERGEDIQALVLNELTQLGIARRGTPYGIDRGALHRLIDSNFPGNDAELKGLLASAVGKAQGELITLRHLPGAEASEDSALPPVALQERSRSRPAPRSRRR